MQFPPYHTHETPGPNAYAPTTQWGRAAGGRILQKYRLPVAESLGDPGQYALPGTLLKRPRSIHQQFRPLQPFCTPAPGQYRPASVQKQISCKILGLREVVDYGLKSQAALPGAKYNIPRGFSQTTHGKIGQKCKYYGVFPM